MGRPKIQIALDMTSLDSALDIASKVARAGADFIEAGTPLIKMNGMRAVKALSESLPAYKIVADMKIVDSGETEVKMAAEAGASIVTILGTAPEVTIERSISMAHSRGMLVMVDMIGVKDLVKTSSKAESLGADYIVIHSGKDEQILGYDPIVHLDELSKRISISIAVAGGLDPRRASRAASMGASVIIVGQYVTSSPEPDKSVREIIKAIENPS